MNTLQTSFRNEHQEIKRLFQELFLIQIQLENFSCEGSNFSDDVEELIKRIDQLLEFLIDLYASLES